MKKVSKGLNLALSLIVTAALLVVWFFVTRGMASGTEQIKLISYGILLYGMTWILDALFSFAKEPDKGTPEEKLQSVQYIRALVGFVFFLAYSALVHAVVSVLFNNGEKGLLITTASAEKCALAFIGFCLFLQNSMHLDGGKLWSLISGGVSFVVGIVLSMFLDLLVTTTIMTAIVMVCLFVDVVVTFQKKGISSKKFIGWQLVYLGILAVAMILRYLTPVHIHDHVPHFLLNAAINLVLAVVIDVVLVIVTRFTNKKSDPEQDKASSAVATN